MELIRSGGLSYDDNPASEVTPLDGDWNPDRMIVLEFDSKEQIGKLVESDAYQAIVHLRTSSSSTRSVLVNRYQRSE